MPVDPLTMAICRIGPDQAALLAETAERLFRESFSLQNDPRQIDAYCLEHFAEDTQRAELLDPSREAWCALAGARLIGYAYLCVGARPAAPVDVGRAPAELERIYVDHEYHGQGVARRLMDTCVARARAQGVDTLWLGVWQENPRAIAFYRKCGFAIVGEQVFMLGTEAQNDFVMAKGIV